MTDYDHSTTERLIAGYERDFAARMGEVIRRTRETCRDPADWGLMDGRLESWLATVEGEWADRPYAADIRFDGEAEAVWPLEPVNVRKPDREKLPFTQAVFGLKFKVQPDSPLNIGVKIR